MLVPALLYKEELEKRFTEMMYDNRMFYYAGYAHCHEIPKISSTDYNYQYASIRPNTVTESKKLNGEYEVIGYLAYRVDSVIDTVHNFGLVGFCDKLNTTFAKDLMEKMEELCAMYHRVEWRMIGGNPVQRTYDKFCKKHGGNSVILHDAAKDEDGNYHDEIIYEIINPNK